MNKDYLLNEINRRRGDGEGERLLKEAVELAKNAKDKDNFSISYVQRKLRLGYTTTAQLFDIMAIDGIIEPYSPGKTTRRVLI